MLPKRYSHSINIPGIVVFRKLQSDAFVRLQTYLPLVLVFFLNCLESYESIALKLAEDDYAWFPHVYRLKTIAYLALS